MSIYRTNVLALYSRQPDTLDRRHLTPLSPFFFFLGSVSRFAFMPFSSPGIGPDSFKAAMSPGLGFLNTYIKPPEAGQPPAAQCQRWGHGATDDGMLGLVSVALKVQVVRNRMITTLVHGREDDLHVELSPSFLLNSERWAREGCTDRPRQ